MQSVNGEVDKSLGLARNVPLRIGEITLYVQIHVICSPAYNILLGRPFDILTESVVCNFANEDQTITIFDPNSRRCATVDTHPISLYTKTRLISHFTNSLRFDSDLIDIAHISTSFSSSSYGIMPPCLQTYCSLLSVYWYTFNIILLSFSSATHPRILVFSQFAGTLQPCSSLQSLVLPHL